MSAGTVGPVVTASKAPPKRADSTTLQRLLNNRHFLGLLFMLPAATLLLLFLTYPLGLGVWLGFTDAKVGRSGHWIWFENFAYLIGDQVAQLSLFNTFFYTLVASVLKFVLGLWLALLLDRNQLLKSFVRAVVLLPFAKPSKIVSHHIRLDDAPNAYEKFDQRIDGYTKVLIHFGEAKAA